MGPDGTCLADYSSIQFFFNICWLFFKMFYSQDAMTTAMN